MPATFPSHAAAVLPLKLWRPRWFDGVALVVGSCAPDLWYVIECCGTVRTFGHTWWGSLASVPAIMVAAYLVRWAAPTVAAHLPQFGPMRLRDYGALPLAPHRWWITASSAWLGAASHLAWDHVTHAGLGDTGLGVASLAAPALGSITWATVLHGLSTVLGLAGTIWVFVYIGRRRLVSRWYGPAGSPSHPFPFWGTAGSVGLLGILVGVGMSPPHPVTALVRLLVTAAVALLAAAAVVRVSRPRRSLPRTGPTPSNRCPD